MDGSMYASYLNTKLLFPQRNGQHIHHDIMTAYALMLYNPKALPVLGDPKGDTCTKDELAVNREMNKRQQVFAWHHLGPLRRC